MRRTLVPYLGAWLVTLIWGSSFLLIKLGLEELPPLTFAALRYTSGGVLLLLWLAVSKRGLHPPRLSRHTWTRVALTGVAAFTIGQGLFYLGQTYVSALTGSFFYSLVPLFVILLGVAAFRSLPRPLQLFGLAVTLIGGALYFPPDLFGARWPGVLLMIASDAATAGYLLLTRVLRQDSDLPSPWLTAVALLVGGGLLLPVALVLEGVTRPSARALLILAFLATVNTALAYTLWAILLRRIRAFELSVVANTIPLQTALIAWLAFGSRTTLRELLGLLVVVLGVAIVQGGAPAPATGLPKRKA